MKRTLTTVAVLTVALAAPALAQTDRAAAEKQIVANERAVTAAFEKRDAATIQKHLLPDGAAVDGMGPSGVADVLKILSEFKIQPGSKIESVRMLWVDDNTAVHIHKWIGKGTVMGQPIPSPTWASTVWTRRGGQWLAVFHQETAAIEPPPPPPAKK